MATNLFNDGCSSLDTMELLKEGYNKCYFNNGQLEPCDYHKSRAESEIKCIADGGGCNTEGIENSNIWIGNINGSDDLKEILKSISVGENIAGGWWLIAEQRIWLKNRLSAIFQSYNTTSDHKYLLVSGVAGYAHFYSYLRIVIEAAKEAHFNLKRLNIDIVDSCITPILEIAHIEQSIRKKRFWFDRSVKRSYDILGYRLNLSCNNIKFINAMLKDIKSVNIRTFHCNILHLGDYCEIMKKNYDIITEHFLISMMQNNKDLIDIHKRHGFVDITEETVKVWDPFGIKRNVIVSIVNELEIDNKDHQLIEQDNVLIHFRFEDKAAEIVEKRISPKE